MATIGFDVEQVVTPSGIPATFVRLSGSIDATSLIQYRSHMDSLANQGVLNVVMDCSKVKYINSTGLGTMLQYVDSFSDKGGNLVFCNVPSKVMLVMEMLGFNALFRIAGTQAEALSWLAPTPQAAAPAPVMEFAAPAAPMAPFVQPAAPPRVAPLRPARRPARAPRPALAPQPPPVPVSPQPAEAPPAPPAAAAGGFPLTLECSRCLVQLEVSSAGKFQCPRCQTVVEVGESAVARFFAPETPRPIEITVPCETSVLDALRALVVTAAVEGGLAGASSDITFLSVKAACESISRYAYDGDKTAVVHIMLLPQQGGKGIEVRMSDHGKPFDFGPGGSPSTDRRFAPVAAGMDSIEHRLIPGGGNLLILTKNPSRR